MTMSGACGEGAGADAQVGSDVEGVATAPHEEGQPGAKDIVDRPERRMHNKVREERFS